MAVKDDLPRVTAQALAEPLEDAVFRLALALQWERRGSTGMMLRHAQFALATIRAWRKGLPAEGGRFDDEWEGRSDRALLRTAVIRVISADSAIGRALDVAFYLRLAEADLRTLIKRHRAGVAPT